MKKILFIYFCFIATLTGFSQNQNAIVEAGELILKPNIPTNPVAGTICWTGTEFLGFDGIKWMSLNGTEADASTTPVKIWSYLFQFPRAFVLVTESNNADSFTGTIKGPGITLNFDHNFLDELSDSGAIAEGDIVTTNTIDGHNVQVIRSANLNDLTKITIQKWDDDTNTNSKLTISVNNITRAQQEMLINVFNTVEIVEPSVSIEIGRYRFQFPVGFSLIPGQGIDSYVGNIVGAGISLGFDYGPYTGPSTNLPATEYVVTEDEIDGRFRQIVKPIDPVNNFTKFFIYNINSKLDDPYFYNRLTISVNNITLAQQEMIIDVFNNVEFTN